MRIELGLSVLCFVLLIPTGCKRSDQNRENDEKPAAENPEEASEETAEGEGAKEADESTDYERLGQMYRSYGEACPAVGDAGAPTGLCRRGMAGMMGRQMMHMHRNYGGWARQPGEGRMRMGGMHGHMRGKGHMRGRGHMGSMEGDAGGMGMMRPGWHPSAMDTWHRQMSQWHEKMAGQMEEAGQVDLAERHRQMMQRHEQMAQMFTEAEPEEETELPSGEGSEKTSRRAAGRQLYASACSSCHGASGEGVEGAFPPLDDASPVTGGEPERLIRIVTWGLEGPVEIDGETYDGVMPSFADRLSDSQIASILTFIRHRWHSGASAISADRVEEVRENRPDGIPLSSADVGLAP